MPGSNSACLFPLLVRRTSLITRYAVPLLPNNPANVYEYGLSQPTTTQGNSSQILSATESSTYLILVSVSYCLVNVPLTILILHDQCLYGMFVTGMFTAAAFQLFSTNAERLRLI